jgi:hypothetical protein
MLHTFLLVISFILLLTSCSSFGGIRPTDDITSNYNKDYQECLDINSTDKSKCDYLIPSRAMQPNLTEHRWKEGYH